MINQTQINLPHNWNSPILLLPTIGSPRGSKVGSMLRPSKGPQLGQNLKIVHATSSNPAVLNTAHSVQEGNQDCTIGSKNEQMVGGKAVHDLGSNQGTSEGPTLGTKLGSMLGRNKCQRRVHRSACRMDLCLELHWVLRLVPNSVHRKEPLRVKS